MHVALKRVCFLMLLNSNFSIYFYQNTRIQRKAFVCKICFYYKLYIFSARTVHASYVIYYQVIEKYLTGGIGCFDKEGSPVRIERFGSLDVKGIFYSCRKHELEKKKLYDQEIALRILKAQSEKVSFMYMLLPLIGRWIIL